MTGALSPADRFPRATLIALLGALAPSAAVAQPVAIPAPSPAIVVTTSLDGQLASLDCAERGAAAPFVTMAAQLDGERGALVLDAGGLIGASTLSRVAVGRDVQAVADAIRDAGYRALAVNHRDLATATLMVIAPELRRRNVPYVLTNLRCGREARATCDALVDAGDAPLLLDGPEGPTAFLAVVAPVWLGRVSRELAAGLVLEDPAAALARAVPAARRAGARRVVVALDADRSEPVERALALVAALPAEARIDMLIDSRQPAGVASIQLSTGGLLVAARNDHAVVVEPRDDVPVRPARSGAAPATVVAPRRRTARPPVRHPAPAAARSTPRPPHRSRWPRAAAARGDARARPRRRGVHQPHRAARSPPVPRRRRRPRRAGGAGRAALRGRDARGAHRGRQAARAGGFAGRSRAVLDRHQRQWRRPAHQRPQARRRLHLPRGHHRLPGRGGRSGDRRQAAAGARDGPFAGEGAARLAGHVLSPSASFAPAWLAGWSLVPGPLFRFAGRPIEAQTNLDFIYRDTAMRPEMVLRLSAKLMFPVVSVISITIGYDLFAHKSSDTPWGAAGNALIGLHIGATRSLQAYRL